MSVEVEDGTGKPDGSFDAIRERREAYLAEVRRLEVELGRTPTAEDMQKRVRSAHRPPIDCSAGGIERSSRRVFERERPAR